MCSSKCYVWTEWINEWVSEWVRDGGSEWVSHCVGEWVRGWVSPWARTACQNTQPFQGAGKHNKRNLHFKFVTFPWMQKVTELIHWKQCVVDTMSPVSTYTKKCKQSGQPFEHFREANSMPAQPMAPVTRWKYNEQTSSMSHANSWRCSNCKRISWFVRLMKDFLLGQRPIHVTRWPHNET